MTVIIDIANLHNVACVYNYNVIQTPCGRDSASHDQLLACMLDNTNKGYEFSSVNKDVHKTVDLL